MFAWRHILIDIHTTNYEHPASNHKSLTDRANQRPKGANNTPAPKIIKAGTHAISLVLLLETLR
jgi:hypothetical protein